MKMLLLYPANLKKTFLNLPAHWKDSVDLCFQIQIKPISALQLQTLTASFPNGSYFCPSSSWNNCGCVMAKYQVKKLEKWEKSEARGCKHTHDCHLHNAVGFIATVCTEVQEANALPWWNLHHMVPRQEAQVCFGILHCLKNTSETANVSHYGNIFATVLVHSEQYVLILSRVPQNRYHYSMV